MGLPKAPTSCNHVLFLRDTSMTCTVLSAGRGGSIVSAGYDRIVREWDVPTQRQVLELPISPFTLIARFFISSRSNK